MATRITAPKCGGGGGASVKTVTCKSCGKGCGTVIDYTFAGSGTGYISCPNCGLRLMVNGNRSTVLRWQTPDKTVWESTPRPCPKCGAQVYFKYVPAAKGNYDGICPNCGGVVMSVSPAYGATTGAKPVAYKHTGGRIVAPPTPTPAPAPKPASGYKMMKHTCQNSRCRAQLWVEYRSGLAASRVKCPKCKAYNTFGLKYVRRLILA